MIGDFLKYIEQNNMAGTSDRILMAVSGGMDSMVMAHLFITAGFDTGIVHCNFCLRGRDSDRDEEMVKKYAGEKKIPFFSKRFNTKEYASTHGISIQMAARDLRYKWFEEIRKKMVFDRIAVAHNLNDNIETLLINLIRGTGITGLTGMRPVAGVIIRPLLFASREIISDYCSLNRIRFREDKSNAETKYTRNMIRHLVMPVLREINPSVETTLQETTVRLSGINEIVAGFISRLKMEVFYERNEQTIIKTVPLHRYLENTSILYELTKEFGITNALMKDLRNIIEGRTGGLIYTDTHRIIKNRNELIITKKTNNDVEYYEMNSVAELKKVPFFKSVISVKMTLNYIIPSDPYTACLDYEKLLFPVIIRHWKKGDIFYPLGMKQRKRLSDYFTDRKYSLPEKEKVFILESAGKIAWIIGERIDDRFRITGKTRKALVIKVQ